MALQAPVGAGNLVTVHAIDNNGVVTASPAFVFSKNVTMDYTGHPKKDSLIIDLDNKIDNEGYNTFLKTYLNSVMVEETKVEYVDASFDTVTSGTQYSTPFAFIWYGGDGTSESKVKTIVGKGILSGDSGNASYQGKGVGNYPVQITTLAAATTVTFPAAAFCGCKITAPGGCVTLSIGERGCILFYSPD